MKKRKSAILFLLFSSSLLSLASCGDSTQAIEVKEREVQTPSRNEKFRSYYEVFPYSFADSNGDGIGDLQGIIDKFDYIASLNVPGIWLTPVHPSSSYHKYDVDDYYSIDSSFGDLATYDALVSKAHENNVNIILDLVLNHTSTNNKWFQECAKAHLEGEIDNPYYDYYNFVEAPSKVAPSGYNMYQDSSWAYECRFSSSMPDLNLQPILDDPSTSSLAKDIENIMKFWLIDHDIDGFRLDATTSYFTGEQKKNIAFLSWLKQTANSIKENNYFVGECWEGESTISAYYTSGIDSFFDFDDSGTGYFAKILNNSSANLFNSVRGYNKETALNGVAAPFIGNHDMKRAIGPVGGRDNLARAKMAEGLLSLSYGSPFTYYGEEIGMASGGSKDEDHRLPMNWGDSYTCKKVSGASSSSEETIYPYGSVASQEKDENSLLNYVRKAQKIRLENPELAKGDSEILFKSEDKSFAIMKVTYQNSSIYLALNLSEENSASFSLTDYNGQTVVASLGANEQPTTDKNKTQITLPSYSYVIFC